MAIHADAPVARERSNWKPSHAKRRVLARVAVAGACAMFVASATHAGELDAFVTPLATPVSLSVNGSQPVATYAVTLKNMSASNTISNGRFVATTTVAGGAAGVTAVFKSVSSGAACTVSVDGTRVDCSVGSLAVNESKQFTLSFLSPASGTSIVLDWDAVFDSGTPPGGSNGVSDRTTIALEPIDSSKVTSAVPPNEAVSVFTGNFAIPGEGDQFTTAITVPPVSISSKANVLEGQLPEANTTCTSLRNFNRCYTTSITVENVVLTAESGEFLTFVLRVDSSNIRKGSKIGKVVIQYQSPEEYGVPAIGPIDLQFCSRDSSNNPMPNTAPGLKYVPCIAYANDYTRKGSSSGWFGYEWIIYNLKNGNFNIM